MTLQTNSKAGTNTPIELLDMLADDPTDIIAFITHCSGDDLHCLRSVHGAAGEVEVFDAILNHPDCDRATALQIFDACNPHYYETELAKGRPLDSYDDEEDQVFIAIIDIAYEVLRRRSDWRGKFTCAALRDWAKFPHTSPTNFSHWTLPDAAIEPTEGFSPISAIEYKYSSIRLNQSSAARLQ
ncbi:MAG: DUF4274 domain-containing protein [Yoonia sp.]|nr:DUF4274 domain-containing protein [Yoonia sp.]